MKINLNSPDGNIFQLTALIESLMEKAGISEQDIIEWTKKSFKDKNYDEIVEECKIKAKELSELLNEEIIIYTSEKYEMK